MELRNINERKRDFKQETSLWNILFLQMYFTIKAIEEYFISLPNEKMTIYDFGCGTKPYQSFCKNKNYIGIDIDTNNKDADIFSDVANVPVQDNVADIVVSFYLLEHVENPLKVLQEKYRILKKGGELFMIVPLYWEEHEQPFDYFRFTRFGIELLLKEVGFEQINIREINTSHSILGFHLARLFDRKMTKFLIPIINYIFCKLEIRAQLKAKKTGKECSNVMSFSVRCKK